MQNVERLSIILPADMAQMIRDKVEEGRYGSDSEVVRVALSSWQASETLRVQRLAAVRAKVDEAHADPRPSLTAIELDRHFAARFKKSVAASKDDA